jgi:hypothetical protein
MNLRLDDLKPHQKEAVERVIRQARAMGRRVAENVGDDGEAYAYPAPHGGISWGFNGEPHGFCIARGIDTGQ